VIAGQEVVLHEPRQIAGYDLATGERRWWVPVTTGAASTPAISGDTAYVATWNNFGEPEQIVPLPDFAGLVRRSDKDADGQVSVEEFPEDVMVAVRPDAPDVEGASFQAKRMFRRFDKSADGRLDESEWQAAIADVGKVQVEHGLVAIRTGGRGDTTATHLRWREKTSVEVPSPLVHDNRVYMVRNGGILTCLDAATGKMLYRARIGAGGPYYASPVVVEGRIFIASGDGTVVVLKAGDALDVVARNDLGAPIFATPAIADGTLYVRTAAELMAFGRK
jgi:outer membrane protein assembly factor BamB